MTASFARRGLFVLGCAIICGWMAPAPGLAQAPTPAYVAPPRTIADITAILDQQKPDPKAVAKLHADTEAKPPAGAARAELARFYFKRCQAFGLLGEFRESIQDCEKAITYGQGSLQPIDLARLRQGLAIQYAAMGDPKRALQIFLQIVREANVKGSQGWLFNAQRNIVDRYTQLGDFNQAEAYVTKNLALIQVARGWPTYAGYRRATWEADVEISKGRLDEGRGRFAGAEASYRKSGSLQA
jgi:tetratricopeptide (TPR) repeat protein